MNETVLLIATFDTKEEEALFLKGRIEARGIRVLTMDTGILAPPIAKSISIKIRLPFEEAFPSNKLWPRAIKGSVY